MRELAVGGGLMALFLPVIVFAIAFTLLALFCGAAFALSVPGTDLAMWPMLVLYYGLLIVMLFFAYKFSARFALLTRRLIGLMRERRRIRTETRSASFAQDAALIEPQSLYEDDDSQSSGHTSR